MVPFLDELESGIAPLSSNELAADFAVSPGAAAGWALLAMQAFAILAEPPLLFAAERYGRHRFVHAGLFAVALSCAAVALAPAWWVVLVALSLFGPATGLVTSLAQATLIDLEPEHPERAMARWNLSGSLGDLSTPVIMAALAALSQGWRAAYLTAAALAFGTALVWPRQGLVPAHRAEEDDDTPRVPFWQAARRPKLWAWLAGVSLCTLLDEPLVAFGAIHLQQRFELAPAWRALALGAWTAGAVLGSVALERLVLRFATEALLVAFGAAAALATLGFAFAPNPVLATVALFAIGVCGTTLHPLSKAQAYRMLPGQAGLVVTLESALMPLELALPLGLGAVLDAWGSPLAMALLAVQPIYLALLAMTVSRGPATK